MSNDYLPTKDRPDTPTRAAARLLLALQEHQLCCDRIRQELNDRFSFEREILGMEVLGYQQRLSQSLLRMNEGVGDVPPSELERE